MSESLCWYCVHAYGDDCFRHSLEQRARVKDFEILERAQLMRVHIVRVCERFECGRRKPPEQWREWVIKVLMNEQAERVAK